MLFNLFSRRKKLDPSPRRPSTSPELPVATAAAPATTVVAAPTVATPAVETPGVPETVAVESAATETATPHTPDTLDTPDTSEFTGDIRTEDAEPLVAVAEPIDTDAPTESPEPDADPEPDVLDLTTLTVPLLRQRAREAGLTGYSRMKKSELIVALATTHDA